MTEPTAVLVAPEAADPRNDFLESALGLSWTSPSWHIANVCNDLFGANPWDLMTEAFLGDWEAIEKAGAAIGSLGSFGGEFATALRDSGTAIDTWTGDTADAARAYFGQVSSALEEQVPSLEAASDQIRELARAIYEHGKAAGDLLQSLTDILAQYLILQAAAAAAAVSGNLPAQLQMMALAALQVVMAADAFSGVMSAIGGAWALFQLCEGNLRAFFATFDSVDLPALPEVSYDNPEV